MQKELLSDKSIPKEYPATDIDSHPMWADASLRPEVILSERDRIFNICSQFIQT